MEANQNLNKFTRLRVKANKLKCDIVFLKKCKQYGVKPNFIKIKCAVSNIVTEKVIKIAKAIWLKLELKNKYAQLEATELELYELHLQLTKDLTWSGYHTDERMNDWVLNLYEIDEKASNDAKIKEKIKTQNKKLNRLIRNKVVDKCKPEQVDDVVCNLSSENFSKDEMDTLNKGLNFAVKPLKTQLMDVIVDIETFLKYKPSVIQNDIRSATKAIIQDFRKSNYRQRKQDMDYNKALKTLNAKDCIYTKADKGNKIVIMRHNEYENRAKKFISDSKYKKSKHHRYLVWSSKATN